jgi:hypothetical protein
MIERGRRSITDRRTLRHISCTLAIPPHVLGITGPDDADFSAMLTFGDSASATSSGSLGAGLSVRRLKRYSRAWSGSSQKQRPHSRRFDGHCGQLVSSLSDGSAVLRRRGRACLARFQVVNLVPAVYVAKGETVDAIGGDPWLPGVQIQPIYGEPD